MQIAGKSFGVWGFGIVGTSVARFLIERGARVNIMEKRLLTEQELSWCAQHEITYFSEQDSPQFWSYHDHIIPSPGISLDRSEVLHDKIITELDLFYHFFKKPIIAITGTIGKTSTTHFVSTTLKALGFNILTGGNIGIGMLDLVAQQDEADYAVLEVSSFQLEYCRFFSPAYAIWTNLYPNHLDRHGTFDRYMAAKLALIVHHSPGQKAILNADLLQYQSFAEYIKTYTGEALFFSKKSFFNTSFKHIYYNNQMIFYAYQDRIFRLLSESALPTISFLDNWLAVIGLLHAMNQKLPHFLNIDYSSPILNHRLEKIETHQAITFYDDSKATVPESTLAAIQVFERQPLILILGGLSKGVDRASLIAQLPPSLKKVICFGAEAEQLSRWCTAYHIDTIAVPSLEDALQYCATIADHTTPVLFSPAGSSFDLFIDYRHRGQRFKELVKQYYDVI